MFDRKEVIGIFKLLFKKVKLVKSFKDFKEKDIKGMKFFVGILNNEKGVKVKLILDLKIL